MIMIENVLESFLVQYFGHLLMLYKFSNLRWLLILLNWIVFGYNFHAVNFPW